jgi:hypothetical protein
LDLGRLPTVSAVTRLHVECGLQQGHGPKEIQMRSNLLGMCSAVAAVAVVSGAAESAVYYSTNFASGYGVGNLVGQNGWTQERNIATNPIQVSGGEAVIGTSGQDAYRALSATVPPTAGTTLYFSATLRLTAAQANGDYFMYVSELGYINSLYGRVYARSSGSGFQLGLSSDYLTASSYGTTVLNFNTTYQLVVAWDIVDGAANDTFKLYVDPNSTDRANLVSYASASFNASALEPEVGVTGIYLRQGSASNAPSVRISSLAAGSSLADVGVVPAPGAIALLGIAGFLGSRRRKA